MVRHLDDTKRGRRHRGDGRALYLTANIARQQDRHPAVPNVEHDGIIVPNPDALPIRLVWMCHAHRHGPESKTVDARHLPPVQTQPIDLLA
jgi:hypothetical protein